MTRVSRRAAKPERERFTCSVGEVMIESRPVETRRLFVLSVEEVLTGERDAAWDMRIKGAIVWLRPAAEDPPGAVEAARGHLSAAQRVVVLPRPAGDAPVPERAAEGARAESIADARQVVAEIIGESRAPEDVKQEALRFAERAFAEVGL